MWRVLDNLFGNTVKYALEGTRVYVDLTVENGAAALIIKNISRDPLNIRPEELMERFVRGDQARHTEGSGAGPLHRPQPDGAAGREHGAGHRRRPL